MTIKARARQSERAKRLHRDRKDLIVAQRRLMPRRLPPHPYVVLTVLAAFIPLVTSLPNVAQAQVPPITPSGLNTQISAPTTLPSGQINYNITGGTRPGGGTNLFHSFGNFNVPTNNIANFLNDSGLTTSNILGRVTGGNISNIFGTIQTTGFGNANLFLMNPAGWLFGPTATLNVGGMVTFTSADYLRLADGVKFNTVPGPADALLSVAPVAAFGFLNPSPASITLQGANLQVPPGQAISLIGGDIQVQASQVSAPAGLVQMASVASPGEVALGLPGLVPDPLNVSSFSNLGRIDVQSSAIDVSGSPTVPVGGAILIRGGQFVMENSLLQSLTVAADGGPISILAPSVQMKGGQIQTASLGPAKVGDIQINTTSLSLTDGALIDSLLVSNPLIPGQPQGGTIAITANDSISMSGQRPGTFSFLPSIPGLPQITNTPSGIYSENFSANKGSNIFVQTPSLTLQPGVITSHAFSTGAAGDQTYSLGRLTLKDGGLIASDTFADGSAGLVQIVATEQISISGHSGRSFTVGDLVFPDNDSGIATSTFGAGKSGDIAVTTPTLTMFADGIIQAATGSDGAAGNISVNAGKIDLASGGLISSSSGLILGDLFLVGNGAGGNIRVTATDSLTIAGHSALTPTRPSGLLTTAVGGGPGGNVTVQAAQLQMQERAVISAETRGPGPAGDITLDVTSAILNGGALVSSNTFSSGKGGQVTVRATESLTLSGETEDPVIIGGVTFPHLPSGISSAAFADGQGGRITVSAPTLTMQKGGIGAQSERSASGNAGEVVVDAGRLVLTEGALITASTAGAGQGGNVTVRATDSISIDGHRTDEFPSGNTIFTNAPSGIFTNAYGTGKGGLVSVSSPILTMGEVQGSGEIGANTFGPANAGNILVEVGSLTLRNGATISGTTLGTGDGGTVAVRATDSISISGRHPGSFTIGSLAFKNNQSGIISLAPAEGKAGHISVSAADLGLHDEGVIAAPTGGAGAAGDVVVNTGTLSLTSGAQINSGSGFRIGDTSFVGDGAGGTVTVNASGPVAISDQGSGLFTSAVGNGAGGNINLRGSGIQLSNGASISATSAGIGNAGNITINAGNQFLSNNSSVATQAAHASGGNITVTAADLVHLTNSQITASVQGAQTTIGGNIVIDPQFVVLQNSQILAQATQGQGGNITITTPVFLTDATSIVSASSQSGVNGTVSFQSPIAQAGGKIVPLSKTTLETTALLGQRCAAMVAGGQFSSFVLAGREALPTEPGGWMMSPLAFETAAAGPVVQGEGAGSVVASSVVASGGDSVSLRRLPPGAGIKIFSTDWTAGCGS